MMVRIIIGTIISILIVAFMVRCSPSHAHSLYSPACCKGTDHHGDCEPIPFESVEETENGYHIVFDSPTQGRVNEIVPYGFPNIYDSQDGRWHVCLKPREFKPRIRCLYRAVNS